MEVELPPSHDDELREVLRLELRESIKYHLEEHAATACGKVDLFLRSALRSLPPEIRAMPIEQAFKFPVGREFLSNASRTTVGQAGVSGPRLPTSHTLQGKPPEDARELLYNYQAADELSQEIRRVTENLEDMSREQRLSMVEQLKRAAARMSTNSDHSIFKPNTGAGGA